MTTIRAPSKEKAKGKYRAHTREAFVSCFLFLGVVDAPASALFGAWARTILFVLVFCFALNLVARRARQTALPSSRPAVDGPTCAHLIAVPRLDSFVRKKRRAPVAKGHALRRLCRAAPLWDRRIVGTRRRGPSGKKKHANGIANVSIGRGKKSDIFLAGYPPSSSASFAHALSQCLPGAPSRRVWFVSLFFSWNEEKDVGKQEKRCRPRRWDI